MSPAATKVEHPVERHPLQPFLPPNARLLMLGSFPPPKARWCMDFFYPNRTNMMWEIFGLVFFDDHNRLVDVEKATFMNVLSIIESHSELFEGKKVFINSIPGIKISEEDVKWVSKHLEKVAEPILFLAEHEKLSVFLE